MDIVKKFKNIFIYKILILGNIETIHKKLKST